MPRIIKTYFSSYPMVSKHLSWDSRLARKTFVMLLCHPNNIRRSFFIFYFFYSSLFYVESNILFPFFPSFFFLKNVLRFNLLSEINYNILVQFFSPFCLRISSAVSFRISSGISHAFTLFLPPANNLDQDTSLPLVTLLVSMTMTYLPSHFPLASVTLFCLARVKHVEQLGFQIGD